ncbi:Bug family tripartite tricarboxylate transporter substrate binding protein [Rhodoplanes roseus]|uniref:ABC transporter substrate-binding protein n=1 Tax=Rhodoplanes roseus TaxID=29409 RepID=A0A327L7V6_9BRAD|nr:tripartite tricarboxylate transporter substrate binding protein [Rhodoplanes roseus]RAI45983.1 ABC transporter substrate-binding protein [Rhodoplanes roseus]
MSTVSRRSALRILAGSSVLAPAVVRAQDSFPSRPVTMIVPFPAGGPTDVTARVLADKLSGVIGHPVVVDNRAGASGNVAAQIAARATPDGYTLFFGTGGTHGANPALFKNPGYDPIKSFAPVAWATTSPNIVVVNPEFPARTLAELIALAKANPGKYNAAAPGHGSTPHMAGELFKVAAGINILHVSYRGSGPALNDVVAGHVPIMFDGVPSSLPLVQTGKLRALALTSLERLSTAPDIPTIAETIPGFEADGWFAVYAPAGTPEPVVTSLNLAVNRALPEAKARYAELGVVTVGGSPEKLAARVESEVRKWSDLVARTGLRGEN